VGLPKNPQGICPGVSTLPYGYCIIFCEDQLVAVTCWCVSVWQPQQQSQDEDSKKQLDEWAKYVCLQFCCLSTLHWCHKSTELFL